MLMKALRDYTTADGEPLHQYDEFTVDDAVGHKLAAKGIATPAFRVRCLADGLYGTTCRSAGDLIETFCNHPDRLDMKTKVVILADSRLVDGLNLGKGDTGFVRADVAVEMVRRGEARFAESVS